MIHRYFSFSKLFFLFTVSLFFTQYLDYSLLAQSVPQGMHYQAVARGSDGKELRNTKLKVRVTILSEGANGKIQWQEIHDKEETKTNSFGVFNLEIGNGVRQSGIANTFAEIPWGSATHFLKIEIDFGTGYLDMGTTQFLSVPYALYSGYAVNGATGTGENQTLSIDGYALSISNGNTVTLKDSVNDADADPHNEIQNLSISGRTLSISKGNSVTLTDSVADADADPKNEIQDLDLTGNTLKITGNDDANPIDLSKYLDNTDDNDPDSTNELITKIELDGNNLKVTEGSGVKSVDLSKYEKVSFLGFRVRKSSQTTLSQIFVDTTLMFTDEEININSCFNLSTGEFIAPLEGVYSFSVNYTAPNGSQILKLFKNGNVLQVLFNDLESNKTVTAGFILYLQVGSKIKIVVDTGFESASVSKIGTGTFNGYLVNTP